jgi:RNA polymerase sigma-70 factor, ECF subfamily
MLPSSIEGLVRPATPYSPEAGIAGALRRPGVTIDLVERARHGDHDAFEALASAAYHRLFAIASRILRDQYAAEDAVQEALVRAWRDLPGLRETDRFDAWLHRLLVRACADQGRRARRYRPEVSGLEVEAKEPSDDVARIADRDELERAFLGLSVEHRSVMVLVHYVGLSAPEVATILGVPAGTVYSRLHYAARQMRELLSVTSPLAGGEQAR